MLSLIKDVAQKLPPLMGQIVRFGTLVGQDQRSFWKA